MTLLLTFLANALWQLPLLAATCALLVRFARPAPQNAYRIWLLTLGLCVVLPLAGALRAVQRPVARAVSQAAPPHSAPRQTLALPADLSLTLAVLSGAQAPTYAPEAQRPAPIAAPHVIARAASHAPALWTRLAHAATRVSFRPVALPRRAAQSIAVLWLVCCAWALARLLLRRRATVSLLVDAQPLALPPAVFAEYRHCARSLHVTAPPVAASAHAGPALAGLAHPVLLLPPNFSCRPPAERQAVFAHELAHLSRRDPWTQLLAECVMVPLRWHPAALWVLRELDRTRELATDRLAAQHLTSAQDYAASLLSLAHAMLSRAGHPPFALGLFPYPSQPTLLEQRIMQLTQPAIVVPLRRRVPAALAGCLLACTAVAWAAASPVALTTGAQTAPAPAVRPAPSGPLPPVSAPAPLPAPVAAAPSPALAPTAAPTADPTAPAAAPVPVLPATPAGAAPPPLPPDAPETLPTAEPAFPALPLDPHAGVAVVTGFPQRDEPVAIAHGPSASVSTAPGTYLHRWTGRDGQPWVAATRDPQPLTAGQERVLEENTAKLLSSIDAAKIQQQVEQSTAFLRSPAFQKQMAEAGKLDSEKLQQQLNRSTLFLRSPAFQKQMAEAGKLDSEKLQQQLNQSTLFLRNPAFEKQMQLRMQSTAQMQAQIAVLQAKVAALEHQLAAQHGAH